MRIDEVNQLTNVPYINKLDQAVPISEEPVFDNVLTSVMGLISETNDYQILADKAQLDFITGKNDSMLSVMLAQEKAYAALNFTVQVTNKIVDAYKEIMRIQL